MNLHDSKALFPELELNTELSRAYIGQCNTLCYSEYLPFDEVLGLFTSVRDFLRLDIEEEE